MIIVGDAVFSIFQFCFFLVIVERMLLPLKMRVKSALPFVKTHTRAIPTATTRLNETERNAQKKRKKKRKRKKK